jgi:hypothetical protein
MPRIFDNIEQQLLPALRDALGVEDAQAREPQIICSLGIRKD